MVVGVAEIKQRAYDITGSQHRTALARHPRAFKWRRGWAGPGRGGDGRSSPPPRRPRRRPVAASEDVGGGTTDRRRPCYRPTLAATPEGRPLQHPHRAEHPRANASTLPPHTHFFFSGYINLKSGSALDKHLFLKCAVPPPPPSTRSPRPLPGSAAGPPPRVSGDKGC